MCLLEEGMGLFNFSFCLYCDDMGVLRMGGQGSPQGSMRRILFPAEDSVFLLFLSLPRGVIPFISLVWPVVCHIIAFIMQVSLHLIL